MDPLGIAAILLLIGVVLLVAEIIIPSHGLLSVLAAAAFTGGVVYSFKSGLLLGVIVLAVLVVASPFVFMWMMQLWPKTWVGKRLVLNATTPPPEKASAVAVGQVGCTVTELRPIGECDFGTTREEVISEHGLIKSGTQVIVIHHEVGGRPVVRIKPAEAMV